ncbi:MAG: heparinase II/III family protein [Prevotella sp.]|nr:heparinase II/III family protein [Prevotella sp.]
MKKTIVCLILSAMMFIDCHAIDFQQVKAKDHPRLLASAADFQAIRRRCRQDKIWKEINTRTLQACDRLLEQPILKKEMVGIRMLSTSREALYRIFMLAYAYRYTGNRKYADKAKQEMTAYASFENWNPSHFLDVAEMTTAMAIGYDWLHCQLSPRNRKQIQEAILDKGLRPSMDAKYNGFLQRTNNWAQVCNTALAYGAIVLMDKEPQLSMTILERSLKLIQVPMTNYSPYGAYPEGYGYWQYGTSYNVMMLAELQYLFADDFGLAATSGFMQTGSFLINMIGPSGLPFNYGDSGGGQRLNTSLFWFAKRTGNHALVRNELQLLLHQQKYDYDEYWRFLPTIFLFGKDMDFQELASTTPTQFVASEKIPVWLMRTSGSTQALYCAAKGGSPSDNTHTHMDGGSFVFDALGERWIADLGPQDYNSVEQKGLSIWDVSQQSDRWKVYRNTNFAHNVMTVDNSLFRVNGRAVLTDTI